MVDVIKKSLQNHAYKKYTIYKILTLLQKFTPKLKIYKQPFSIPD